MSQAQQHEDKKSQRGKNRGRGRRPTSIDDPEAGGPIRPRPRKPPPPPSGDLCDYDICCHFGLRCVNEHTPAAIEFFKRREFLKLELRELQMKAEQKKIELQRQRVVDRKPLCDTTNRGAAAATAKPKPRAQRQEKQAAPGPTPNTATTQPQAQNYATTASGSLQATPGRLEVTPSMLCPVVLPKYPEDDHGHRPHERCAYHRTSCGDACPMRAGGKYTKIWHVTTEISIPGNEGPFWGNDTHLTHMSKSKTQGDTIHAHHALARSQQDV